MLELLQRCWNFVCDAAISLYGLLEQLVLFVWDLLVILHVGHPRLEGLLIGITLAWLLSRRDSHPLLRAASSPLKLVLDILDLAWDQSVEFLGDVWGTCVGWSKGIVSWSKLKVISAGSGVVNGLKSVRDKLRKNKEE